MPTISSMPSNPVSFPSHGSELYSSPLYKKNQTPHSPIKKVAAEQLKQSDQIQRPANLQSKVIETPAPGVWDSIVKFFNRQFSTITDSEQQQAQTINLLIGKVEQELNKMTHLAKQIAYVEKALSGKLPCEKTVTANAAYLKEGRKLLDKATAHLEKLKEHANIAYQLADEHAAFDHLPLEIEKLEKNVQYLEARCQVLEKLLNLETVMKDYCNNETWDQFVEVREKRQELTFALRAIFTENQSLIEDVQATEYVKQDVSTGEQIYLLVKTAFPGLKGYIERLLDSSLAIHQGRVEKLYQQVGNLKPLFSKYSNLSKSINNLDYAIHDESLIGRIYRIFHSKTKLRKQLQQIQQEQKDVFNTIQTKGVFHPTEMRWFEEQIKNNWRLSDLKEDITAIQQEMAYLNVRQNMADQTSQLLNHLEFYRKHKEEEGNLTFVDYKKLKATIAADIQLIAQNVQNWRFKTKALPANFTKLDLLDQLTNLISVSFPTLRERNRIICDLIEELELHEDLNQAIEDREIPGVTTAKPNVETSEDQQIQKTSESIDEDEPTLSSPQDEENKEKSDVSHVYSQIPPVSSRPIVVKLSDSSKDDERIEKKERIEKRTYTAIPPILPRSDATEVEESPKEEMSSEPSLTQSKVPTPPTPPTPPKPPVPPKPPTPPKSSNDANEGEKPVDLLSQIKQGHPLKKVEISEEKPVDLLSQIKQGHPLKKVEVDSSMQAPEQQAPDLLSQIRQGHPLKKVEAQTKSKKITTACDRLLEQVELGNLTIAPNVFEFKGDGLSKAMQASLLEDWDSLSLTERLKVSMSARSIAMGGSEHPDNIDDNDEEWDD